MAITVNITKRTRRRKLKSGEVAVQIRWVLNYRDPKTGQRHQLLPMQALKPITEPYLAIIDAYAKALKSVGGGNGQCNQRRLREAQRSRGTK
jgi:hypothetical protein